MDVNKYIVRIYIKVTWQLWSWYVQKHVFMEKLFQAVAISDVGLHKLNHPYSLFHGRKQQREATVFIQA